MAKTKRDDFSARVIRIIAARAGYRCSNPDCRQPTSGPQADPTGAVNIGVAAHITAASPGGPRYDPNLSPEERSSFENAIWLCQSCAKLIDSDEQEYTVERGLREAAAATVTSLHQIESPPGDFTGRGAELDELREALEAHSGVAICGLRGLGGIGKTALALKLAEPTASWPPCRAEPGRG